MRFSYLPLGFLAILFALVLLARPLPAREQTWETQIGYHFLALEVTPDPTRTSRQLLESYPGLKGIFRFDPLRQAFAFHLRLADQDLLGESFDISPLSGYILQTESPLAIAWSGTAVAGDPFSTTRQGFLFAGLPTAAGTAAELLGRLGGFRSVFGWNPDRSAFDFVVRLDDNSLFGSDFSLESGRGYLLNYSGPRSSGQGRFRLDGRLRIAAAAGASPVPAAGATLTLAGLSTTTDPDGRFLLQGSTLGLGTQELAVQFGSLRLSRQILVADPVQMLTDWQYDQGLGRHLFLDARVDAAAAGLLGLYTRLACRNGAVEQVLTEREWPALADTLSQPAVLAQLAAAWQSDWQQAAGADCLNGFSVLQDQAVWLAGRDLPFRSLLKSIAFSSLPSALAVGSGVKISLAAVWSDGADTTPPTPLVSLSDSQNAGISGEVLLALGPGETVLQASSAGLVATASVRLLASPLVHQEITDPSSGSFKLAIRLDTAGALTLRYLPSGASTEQIIPSPLAREHLLTLTGLAAESSVSWQLDFQGTENLRLNDGGQPFRFTTLAVPVSIPQTLSLGARAVDAGNLPLAGALGLVQLDGAWPLAGLTDANGVFVVNLGNLRDRTSGAQMSVGVGQSVRISLYRSGSSVVDQLYTLSGDGPYEAGTFILP